MTFRHEIEENMLDVAPGDMESLRITVHNDASAAVDFAVRVVGLDDRLTAAAAEVVTVTVEPGGSAICAVPVRVPANIGTGRHAAAIEITSNQPGSRPVLSEFTLSVSSLAGLEISATPTPVRAKRRAKFHVDVVNHEDEPLDFTLVGEAPDVRVKFEETTFQLYPGDRATTRTQLRATRLWRGEPIQHNVLITAHGRASTATATVPYVQRPVFARGLRSAMAALLLVGLWAGAMFAGYLWLRERDEAAQRAAAASITGVDTDGDGVADVFYDENGVLVAAPKAVDFDGDGITDGHVDADGKTIQVVTALDTDGDGIADVFLDETGAPVANPSIGPDEAGKSGEPDVPDEPDEILSTATPDDDADASSAVVAPEFTSFGGKVSAEGTTDVSDIQIVVAPIQLGGAENPSAEVVAFAGEQARRPGKIWSARRASASNQFATIRQSEAIAPPFSPDTEGAWGIDRIPLRRSYEVSFSKAGFDTQSFVLTPPDDGVRVELDVVLSPAIGAIRGRVIGPTGPLGGADISITDGTITFETTADTDGDIGVYLLERLSTPGVYTLTATLRGFGTEVVQVELTAGQQRSDVDIRLTPGVGTVTGRIVDETGRALPGASISASNGANDRETSSLTEGDIGSYSLPQLDISTTYTLKVSLGGYSFSTRRIPVNGSVSGVNFVLVRSSSSITGQVNKANGDGAVAAGVTIASGDLEFRTSTTNAPDGFFEVDDLPPGNYTVTIAHFEHLTATEFLVVEAGKNPPALQIDLVALGDTAAVGTGELVVEVIDPDALEAAERPVAALVQLTSVNGDVTVPTPTTPASTVRIQNIQPGTYTLIATAEGYADSAPRQVSIGLQQEKREIELQRKGQAGGRMVDSLTKQPIGPFVLDLFLIIGNDELLVDSVIGGTDGLWETDARALIPGDYRLRISATGAPNGYRVLNDQQLDPLSTQTMRFTVVPGLEATNMVNDIEADPYPDISGRVFSPRLLPTNATQLVPIDVAGDALTATLTCAGKPGSIAATITDRFPEGTPDAPLFDSFNITKQNIDDAQLTGNCEILVSAGGFVSSTISLPNLLPSDGVNDNDRVTNTALYSPTDTIGGTVFWIDDRDGSKVFLDDVDFNTNAIVSIPPNEGPPPPEGPVPTPVFRNLATRSDGGAWALIGQVFGPATYQIDEEGFNRTEFDAVIDENRIREVTAGAGITMSPTSPSREPISPGVSYDLELNAPRDQTIAGNVTIRTESPSPDYAGVVVEAFEPDQPAPPASRVPTALLIDPTPLIDGSFTVVDAPVGTWDVEYTLPDNHIFYGPTLAQSTPVDADTRRVTERLDPGDPFGVENRFNIEMVDLAKIDISATNLSDDSAIGSEVKASITPRSVGFGEAQSASTATAGVVALTDVVVDAVNPTSEVTYDVLVTVPGFDPASAVVKIDGTVVATDTSVPFQVRVAAGRDVNVTVQILPYGQIITSIFGEIGAIPSPDEPLDVISPTGTGRAVVIPTYVQINGGPATLPANEEVLIEPTGNPGEFRVSGPQGFYRLDVSHPQFLPPRLIPMDGFFRLPLAPKPVSGVYEMRGAETNPLSGLFTLPIRRGALEINGVDQDANVVSPFTYTLTQGGLPIADGTDIAGTATIPNLLPGTYKLDVRDGVERFPFIADIAVRRTESPLLTTVVTAPLPAAGATIRTGVSALNSEATPAPAPLPDTELTRLYTSSFPGSESDNRGGASDPLFNEQIGTQTIDVSDVGIPPTGRVGVDFTDLVAVGVHRLTVPDRPGYATPLPLDVNVQDTAINVAGDLVYTALDVDVLVTVNAVPNGTFTNPGLVVTLTSPSNVVTTGMRSGPNPLTAPVFTFLEQAPSIAQYTLTVIDPLYGGTAAPFTKLVSVGVGDASVGAPRAEVLLADVSPDGVVGRLVGEIVEGPNRLNPEGTTVTMTPTRLDDSPPATPIGDAITVVVAAGGYFQEFAAGDYTLAIDGGTDFSSQALPVTITKGVETTKNLEVITLADVTVTTTPSPLPNGVTVSLRELTPPAPTDDILPISPDLPFAFKVIPGKVYNVVVSGGGYPETLFPVVPGGAVVPATGADAQVVVPQIVTVNVTNAPTGLVVDLGEDAPDTPAPIVSDIDAAGTGTFTATFTNVSSRELRLSVPDGSATTPPTLTPLGFTTLAEELLPSTTINFTTLSGTLTFSDTAPIPNNTTITLTSGFGGETTTITHPVTGNSYSFDGLIGNLPGAGRNWTVNLNQPGLGEILLNNTISIDGSIPDETRNLVVTPREYVVTFAFTGIDTQSVSPATVTMAGADPDPGNSQRFTVRETQGELSWTAVAGGISLEANGSFNASEQRVAITVNSPLTQKPLAISITTTETGSTFEVCKGDPASANACNGPPERGPFDVDINSFNTTVPAIGPKKNAENYFVRLLRPLDIAGQQQTPIDRPFVVNPDGSVASVSTMFDGIEVSVFPVVP